MEYILQNVTGKSLELKAGHYKKLFQIHHFHCFQQLSDYQPIK